MLDELTLRRILREEVERLIPRMEPPKPLLSIPDCIKRYGHCHAFFRELIRRGEIEFTHVANGKGGRPQYFVKLESAERHPQLGGRL